MSFPRLTKVIAAILVIMLITAVGLAYWLSDARRLETFLSYVVASTTPYELQLSEFQVEWKPLRVRSPLLLLRYANPEKPPIVSVQSLDFSLPATQLLSGNIDTGHLRAANVSYYIDDTESDDPPDLEMLLSPLSRLPKNLEIDSLHLIAGGEELWIFPLLGLTAEREDDGSLIAKTGAVFGGRRVDLDARARWETTPGGAHYLELDGKLNDGDGISGLSLNGRLDADGPRLTYGFGLSGYYAKIGDFIAALDDGAFPFEGDLRVQGDLKGDLAGYELNIEELTLTTPGAYLFNATGSATRSGNDPIRLQLEARGDAQRIESLLPLPRAISDRVSSSELFLDIGGTLDEPLIEALGISLAAAGETRLTLRAEDQAIAIETLDDLSINDTIKGQFELTSARIGELANAAGKNSIADLPRDFRATGEFEGSSESLTVQLQSMTTTIKAFTVSGSATLLWQGEDLAATALTLKLTDSPDSSITANGSVADVLAFHGLGLQLQANSINLGRVLDVFEPQLGSAYPQLAGLSLDGSFLLQRPGNLLIARDIAARLLSPSGITMDLQGGLRIAPQGPEADLDFSLDAPAASAWFDDYGLPLGPDTLSGQARVRPGYATILATTSLGSTPLQTIVSADLEQNQIAEVGIDFYTPSLALDDFSQLFNSELDNSAEDVEASPPTLPDLPMHITLRADRVQGALTDLEHISIAVDADDDRLLLRKLDSIYAGGELSLRGVVDLSVDPAAISLAGRGIRVPLGALTQDLAFQESVEGDLSLRGGLSTRGLSMTSSMESLRGNLSLALTDTKVSGAAYDLLMSNVLAWIVQGASDKTTTFDCTMASFDIEDGVARSQNIYVETPRMLASGKGRIDLPGDNIDLRLEPRSKNRTIQFPSAVRIRGPLDDPGVSVSALQATADLSAQALLLLPSLPLKLFGIGGRDDQLLPCETPSL